MTQRGNSQPNPPVLAEGKPNGGAGTGITAAAPAQGALCRPSGTFVVRISYSEPGHYAISSKTRDNKIVSMLILPTWVRGRRRARMHTRTAGGPLCFMALPVPLVCHNGRRV
jgi:hypothetical protein